MLTLFLNTVLKTFLFLWLLTLERVVGLPVAFLALGWGWLGDLREEKTKEKYLGLFFLASLLAIVYQLSFVFSVGVMILGLVTVILMKKTSLSVHWQWVIIGILGAILVGSKIDYEWSGWSLVQIVVSSLLVLITKRARSVTNRNRN